MKNKWFDHVFSFLIHTMNVNHSQYFFGGITNKISMIMGYKTKLSQHYQL